MAMNKICFNNHICTNIMQLDQKRFKKFADLVLTKKFFTTSAHNFKVDCSISNIESSQLSVS